MVKKIKWLSFVTIVGLSLLITYGAATMLTVNIMHSIIPAIPQIGMKWGCILFATTTIAFLTISKVVDTMKKERYNTSHE